MPTLIEVKPDLRVRTPSGTVLEQPRQPASPLQSRKFGGPTPGVVAMPSANPIGAAIAAGDPVAAALEEQDMVLVGTLPLRTVPGPGGVRAAPDGPVEIQVDLAPDESAVVLLEQDGFYSWHLKTTETAPVGAQRGGRGGSRTAVFLLPLEGARGPAARSFLTNLITERAQAFIFKFAGRFLLERAAAFLERKVRTGVVALGSDDPALWQDLPDFSVLQLPSDRPARILLFVHGTFSSTRGGFGGLGATPWGRSFLAAARANYDAVVGFDHPTLSVDPLANATELLASLEKRDWKQGAIIDAVSHSRGGIVLRSLIERLLPAAALPVRFERAVFVGAVNGGTELAEAKNWESLINLYTNLAVGASKAVQLFVPQSIFATTLIAELLKSVGAFAKLLAEQTINEQVVPGLAAMQPQGAFIVDLNKTQPGQPTATDAKFYAITSEFRARLALNSASELPGKLLLALADGAVDQLMGVANDLVVNTDSMTRIDPETGVFIKDTLAFGENGTVYHTNYFLQPQVTNALARWFELELPQVAALARARGLSHAMLPTAEVPARVDVDVLVVPAEDTVGETVERIKAKAPTYVVVDRVLKEGLRHYAFETGEVLRSGAGKNSATLLDALDLHETDASPEGPVAELKPPDATAQRPNGRRAVAMEGTKVLGVMEATVQPTPLLELVDLASRVSVPQSIEDQVTVRKVMPTFAASAISVGAAPAPPPMTSRSIGGGTRSGSPLPPPMAPQPGPDGGPSSLSTDSPSTLVDCNILAEMDDPVVVGQKTSVDVTLSRDAIEALRAATAAVGVAVQAGKKLGIELIPKKNFVVIGANRLEVDVPAAGKAAGYSFEVQGTDVGEGQIVLRIRQEMALLATLTLRSQITADANQPAVRRPETIRIHETPPVNLPLHELTIIEGERGGQKFYQYILQSPSLRLSHFYESKPLVGSREDFIKGVFADIESRYLGVNKDYEEFQKELREVGGGLWKELFPEPLQKVLWENRNKIRSILVFAEEPFIPWELVHLMAPGQGLGAETCFFGQMGLVRWLHRTDSQRMDWPPEELRARPGKCHFVIPKYPHPDYRLPGAEAEEKFLREKFQATPVDPHPSPVRDLLQAGGFDLLHFACHGVADSQDIARAELLLEGRVEGANYVTEKLRATTIENIDNLSDPDGVGPIVVLNACQAGRAGYKMTSIGGFSRAFLGQGAGLFVAALWSVGDLPARVFTEKLYEELLANKTLADATIAAREAARQAGEATWLAYTVYGNPHARLKT